MVDLYPDTEISVSNLTGSIGDLDTQGSGWYEADDEAVDTELHVGMEDPGGDLGGEQTVVFEVRISTVLEDADVDFFLYEDGSEVEQLGGNVEVTDTDGHTITETFDASSISNAADVEFLIHGNSTADFYDAAVEIGFVEWQASIADPSTTVEGQTSLSATGSAGAEAGSATAGETTQQATGSVGAEAGSATAVETDQQAIGSLDATGGLSVDSGYTANYGTRYGGGEVIEATTALSTTGTLTTDAGTGVGYESSQQTTGSLSSTAGRNRDGDASGSATGTLTAEAGRNRDGDAVVSAAGETTVSTGLGVGTDTAQQATATLLAEA
ncbi:MAG: hypothetical protein ACOC8O_00680, partial [Natronomonas sp.]